jgi:two-component system alkaline phosphatase synthesis response regulator PhoP
MGLDAGADDYITKPFGMMELLSRIRAVGRRTMRAPASTFSVGPITMDVRAHRVCVAGKAVALTLKEYNLLALLLAGAGTVLTRDALLTKIWGYDFDGETRTVDVHIRTLRQKLGDAGKMIETVRGVGYRIGKGTEAIGEGSEQR